MALMQAIISLTIPGTYRNAQQDPFLLHLEEVLNKAGIEAGFVDTVSGWGCLDQNWLEFTCEVDTSWGWCDIVPLKNLILDPSEDLEFPRRHWWVVGVDKRSWNDELQRLLHFGQVLMMVHYKKGEDVVPHH